MCSIKKTVTQFKARTEAKKYIVNENAINKNGENHMSNLKRTHKKNKSRIKWCQRQKKCCAN